MSFREKYKIICGQKDHRFYLESRKLKTIMAKYTIYTLFLILAIPSTLALNASDESNFNTNESSVNIYEVLVGKVLNISDTPDKWNVNLSSFNYYDSLILRKLSTKPDSYITLTNANLDKYPSLKQALQYPQSIIEVHNNLSQFKELDKLLRNANTRNIMVYNTYYEVTFIVSDPLAPLPERYFELSVQQVIKTSTNVSPGNIVKVVYSKNFEKELNVAKGDIIKIQLWQIEPARINQSLNLTLYQPYQQAEHIINIEHITETPLPTTQSPTKMYKNIPSFQAILFLVAIIVWYYKKHKY